VSKARLVITAVVVEGRRPAEVARTYGLSRSWVYDLVARYRTEGDAAFEPRSRRPHHSPTRTADSTIAVLLEIRRDLASRGLDAGPDTISWHLTHHHQITLSRSTIRRALVTANLIEPAPQKRPKSSYIRFAADLPNECWQADFTHYRLADRRDTEILCWIDDHSRYALSVTAHHHVTGPIVLNAFRTACDRHGPPASTLTDNGLVFTTRFARGGNDGRNAFETELARLGIIQKNSRPNHPTTCGKVERFHQTLKRWLDAQPQPRTLTELQHHLDTFVELYNNTRPHRAHPHRATPATAYTSRPKATPSTHDNPHWRVRHDRINNGKITLRVAGQLHHIGIGRNHERTPVVILIHDLNIRVIHAATGEILRALTLNPQHRYHGTGKPPGGPKGPRKTRPPEPR
jgi:transposase InsO family protein